MKDSLGKSPLPPGAIRVGNSIRYPDIKGDLHPTPSQAIRSNQRSESDLSRGTSGGCGQNSDLVPDKGPSKK